MNETENRVWGTIIILMILVGIYASWRYSVNVDTNLRAYYTKQAELQPTRMGYLTTGTPTNSINSNLIQ